MTFKTFIKGWPLMMTQGKGDPGNFKHVKEELEPFQ